MNSACKYYQVYNTNATVFERPETFGLKSQIRMTATDSISKIQYLFIDSSK